MPPMPPIAVGAMTMMAQPVHGHPLIAWIVFALQMGTAAVLAYGSISWMIRDYRDRLR